MSEPSRRTTDAVAEEVRAVMGRQDIGKSELGRRLNRSHTWVSSRLHGHVPIDFDDLDAIAAALDVPVTDLIPMGTDTRRSLLPAA